MISMLVKFCTIEQRPVEDSWAHQAIKQLHGPDIADKLTYEVEIAPYVRPPTGKEVSDLSENEKTAEAAQSVEAKDTDKQTMVWDNNTWDDGSVWGD
jgi:ribosomal protein L12E/L44/L45/RPP1/RPP2